MGQPSLRLLSGTLSLPAHFLLLLASIFFPLHALIRHVDACRFACVFAAKQKPGWCMGSCRLLKPGHTLWEVSIDAQSVCRCLLFSCFLTAEFFLAVVQYSLLSAHHPLVLLVLLVYENTFLCLISSLLWRSSCSLFQCTMCYWLQRFGSPCSMP